jgi:hypothetical protein
VPLPCGSTPVPARKMNGKIGSSGQDSFQMLGFNFDLQLFGELHLFEDVVDVLDIKVQHRLLLTAQDAVLGNYFFFLVFE